MQPPAIEPITGWGRYPVAHAVTTESEDLPRITQGAVLTRGLGRSYGDASLPAPGASRPVASSLLADRILGFDEATGILKAEAGFSLSELFRIYHPRGWFTPVSPGTQYVTLGGMVASDIHGKNHHVHGTFGNFVKAITLRVASGAVVRATREEHATLFNATLGGMGLTGHILSVEVQLERLPSPWIYQESERFGSMREVFEALNAAGEEWPMTVAWIDTSVRGAAAGRGILTKGRWATADEAPKEHPTLRSAPEVPNFLPNGLMNPFTVRILNAVFYYLHPNRKKQKLVSPEGFFWQLDMLTEWNRGYGTKGFIQYQCVMPRDVDLYARFLAKFQELGGCSFVTVFKDCGPAGDGILSFPQEGTSMAVDIPVGPNIHSLVKQLNEFVVAHGGRIYLAKDSLTDADTFRAMYPRLPEFEAVLDEWDPERRVHSALSRRLGIRC